MLYPWGNDTTMFAVGRKFGIVGCVTKEDLAKPTELESKDKHCFIVSKDSNTTDLTIRHYAGLVSFTNNNVSIMSVKLM
jgi:hypothetical protein